MPAELELKFLIAETDQDKIEQLDFIRQHQIDTIEQQLLENTYFDSDGHELKKAACSLRIRKVGKRYLQTIKAKSTQLAGLHDSLEYEIDIPKQELDLNHIPKTILANANQLKDKLKPIFTTHFSRRFCQLQIADSVVEIALDHGEISNGTQSATISEIELELKSGPIAGIFTAAFALLEALPLRLGEFSKAARGYQLNMPQQYRLQPITPKLNLDHSSIQSLHSLLNSLLANWQNNLQVYHQENTAQALVQIGLAMGYFTSLLSLAKGVIAQHYSKPFLVKLTALSKQLSELANSPSPEQLAQQMKSLDNFLSSNAYQKLLLQILQFSYQYPWQKQSLSALSKKQSRNFRHLVTTTLNRLKRRLRLLYKKRHESAQFLTALEKENYFSEYQIAGLLYPDNMPLSVHLKQVLDTCQQLKKLEVSLKSIPKQQATLYEERKKLIFTLMEHIRFLACDKKASL